MRLPPRAICLAFLQAGLIGVPVRSDTLAVGDPAPKLDVSQWVKGEKVDRFEPDKIYVVEFWATWCEPCRLCMPRLTQLQREYKDGVSFIGVSVWEPDQKKVGPFVEKMAEKMDYRVAVDNVSNDPKAGDRGKMAETWLTAAGEGEIPTAFIIKDGKVAWIGNPIELDRPLAKVVAGKWDFEAAANERREKRAAEARVNASFEKAQRLVQEHKYREAIAGLDKAISATPEQEHRLGLMKVTVLAESEDDDALIAYGSKLMDSVWKENSDALNYLALVITAPERKSKRPPNLLKVALQAAERANDLNHSQSARSLDTLARVCFASGDPERAARLEEEALGLAERDLPQWRERLETYRKAAEAKGR
jgi:thiol-disulfide isomerase/thioredoxin